MANTKYLSINVLFQKFLKFIYSILDVMKRTRVNQIVFSCFFLLCFLNIYAQNEQVNYFIDKLSISSSASYIKTMPNGDTVLISEYKNRNIKLNSNNDFEKIYMGTPFFKNGWYHGSVLIEGGKRSEGTVAYNLVNQKVMFSLGAKQEAIELKPVEFEILGHKFFLLKDIYVASGDKYYEKVVIGDFEIFKGFSSRLEIYSPEKNGYEVNAQGYEGQFNMKYEVFIAKNGRLYSQKPKLKLFSPHQDLAKEIVKKKELNLKNQNDFIRLAEELNKTLNDAKSR
jgi:hypothetical protein